MRQMIVSTNEINEVQKTIMNFVCNWTRSFKTPVPKKEIIIQMKNNGVGESTTIFSIVALIRKGYIRKSVAITKTTEYVQLRGI